MKSRLKLAEVCPTPLVQNKIFARVLRITLNPPNATNKTLCYMVGFQNCVTFGTDREQFVV